jgi:hypothetical protein
MCFYFWNKNIKIRIFNKYQKKNVIFKFNIDQKNNIAKIKTIIEIF